MDVADSDQSPPPPSPPRRIRPDAEEQMRMRRHTLQTVLEQCQQALELLRTAEESPEARDAGGMDASALSDETCSDQDADEVEARQFILECVNSCHLNMQIKDLLIRLCELIKSKIDSASFVENFGSVHMSASHDISDITASWDVVRSTDLWQDKHADGNDESHQDDFIIVSQEDIVDGIASFMAAYLLSLKQTKDISPNQLQKALSKTFSAKKKKSKLRKAWNGSKVVYNMASWGATAIGLYQNPVVFKAATVALWSSCRVISKLF